MLALRPGNRDERALRLADAFWTKKLFGNFLIRPARRDKASWQFHYSRQQLQSYPLQSSFDIAIPLCKMASQLRQNEYSEVIRLSYDRDTPPGHTFISSISPLTVQRLSRELSLARGRIIYEVWDTWSHTIAGYSVPSDIAVVASLYNHGISTKIWNELQ